MKRSKQFSNQNKKNYQATFFWAVIGLITTIFVILLIMNLPTGKINSLDKIEHLVMSEIFLQEVDSDSEERIYYVYIYESSKVNEPGKNTEVKELVLNYANYVKANAKKKYYKNIIIPNIYCFDVDYATHARVKSNTNAPNGTKTFDEFTVDVTTLPALMIIIEGEIAHPDYYSNGIITQMLKIEETLTSKMQEVEEAVAVLKQNVNKNWVAILDKKEFLV